MNKNKTPGKPILNSIANNKAKLGLGSKFKLVANNIMSQKLKIKTDTESNLEETLLKKYQNSSNSNQRSYLKIDTNTRASTDINYLSKNINSNNFVVTEKSKRHSKEAGARYSITKKPLMLTTINVKKENNSNNHENLSDAKSKKKITFYQTAKSNSVNKKDSNSNTNYNSNNMGNSNPAKNSSGNFFKNSPSKNSINNLNNPPLMKKNTFDIPDLSIIKSSPENELRMNLINKKNSNNKEMLRLRKMKSEDDENKLIDKKDLIFDKIYSFNRDFIKLLQKEQNKKFDNLYDYQNHIVEYIADKTSMDNLRKLSQRLKTIREINQSYNVVNKVNWRLFGKIMNENKSEMKSIREGKFGGESEAIKTKEKFTMELGLQKKKQINLNKKFSKYESSLKRISPYIPEYLVEKFTKSLKIIN